METPRRPPLLLSLALVFSGVVLADSYTFVPIDAPGSTSTTPRGINNSGQIVGSYTAAGGTFGFLYSGGTFSNIDAPGAIFTSPSGINSAGQIVGFYDIASDANHHGFLYTGGSFSTVDVPGATGTQALGINDIGQIVGTYTDAAGEHGFLYLDGTFTTLDVPGAISTSPGGINNAGEIVGTYTDANSLVHGFLYSGGGFSSIEPRGRGLGINDAGQIVGISAIEAPGAARGTEPEGINNSGQVAGFYFDANGAEHGFLATPVSQASLTAGGVHTGRWGFAPGQAGSPMARAIGIASSGGTCNLFGTGIVSVGNVQLVINEALGKSSAANDLNADGVVNVLDIQVAINAAMACSSGSSTGTSAVAHLTVQSGNGQVACICITATLQAFQPISVKATDVNGNPVSGATVTWSVTSGQMVLGGGTSITDGTGVATQSMSLLVQQNYTSTNVPYLVSTLQATSNNNPVIFTETQSLVTSQGASVIASNAPLFNGTGLSSTTLSASIGSTLSTPIQTQVAGLEIASNGVPNVSVRIVNQQSTPTITCTTGGGFADPGSVLSDSQGNTNCYPTFSGSGSGTFYVMIGGVPGTTACSNGYGPSPCYLQQFGPYSFTSMPGAPAAVQIVSGNNQVEPIGQMLNPLVAKLVDAKGNAVQGQTMAWSVVPAGAAGLVNGSLVTDNNGEVSTTVSLGSLAIAGVTITCALNSNAGISATFHETVPNALTAMNKISGDNQSAPAGTIFANPLVVQLVNASGPVENIIVRYQMSGPVQLGGTAADTDANGEASLTVGAGNTTGTATVTATAGALTQTFTLTVPAAPSGQPAIANRKR